MIRVEKFQMKHLKGFEGDGVMPDLELTMAQHDMDPRMDIVSLLNGDDKVIAITGIIHRRIGVGEVWTIRGSLIPQHKFQFYKTMKGLMDYIIQFMGLHRVELAINCNWSGGEKWAKSLGFKFESIARAYDYQFNDHAIYTKIKRSL